MSKRMVRARCVNNDRADWASEGVIAFAKTTGQLTESPLEQILMDFLCDLRHWADRENIDWDRVTNRADAHYYEERGHVDCADCKTGRRTR